MHFKWFVKTEFALLFTQYDKLAAKLHANPLKDFPDFEGGDDLEEATAYITNRFVSLSQRQNHQGLLYQHCRQSAEPRGNGHGVLDTLRITMQLGGC